MLVQALIHQKHKNLMIQYLVYMQIIAIISSLYIRFSINFIKNAKNEKKETRIT